LKPEVGLVSMGDHFDYGRGPDYDEIGRNGEQILTWLASHPKDQVVILFGNHDLCRVQELAFETDESFALEQAAAREVEALSADPVAYEKARAEFRERFPRVPTPGLWNRDFASFRVRQRELVQKLLLEDRVQLAAEARLSNGKVVLLNHAGVTMTQLEQLGFTTVPAPNELADRLNAFLRERVQRVADAWRRGEHAALDLSPLHVAGSPGREGHGLLYHRPSNPDRPGAFDKKWEFDPAGARRYSPKSLPLGLVQVVGHSGHHKLRTELEPWVADDAKAHERGGLRTLTWDGQDVEYRMGVIPPGPGAAALILIDGEMSQVEADAYPLLELERVSA